MPRAALLLALLPFVPAGRSAPAQTPPQAAPPAATGDRTPSDPAATGFLTGVVDRRLYSLEAAGAGKVVATVHAAWEGKNEVPPAVDFEVTCDYVSGAVTTRPVGNPAAAAQPYLPLLYSIGHQALALLPSRVANNYIVTLAQEKEQVRLDFKPRTANGAQKGYSEWYKADGTPLRRRADMVDPADATATRSVEVLLEYTEADSRLLLKGQTPKDANAKFSATYEYETVAGFRVVKKITQLSEGVRLVLDFKSKVEAAAK